MNSFTKKAAKAVVSTVVLGSILFGAIACDNGKHPAESDPTSPAVSQSPTPVTAPAVTPAPTDTGLTQAQRDAAIAGSIAKQFNVDPTSVPVPEDVRAAFGEKAAANLVHDTLAFEQMTDGFRQLQVLPRPVDMTFMAGIVSARLSPMMTTDTDILSDTMKQFSSPAGTSVIPMFADDDLDGILVGDKKYHATGDLGFVFNYGAPVVTMGTGTVDVVRNGETMKVRPANVSQAVEFTFLAKEGTVKFSMVRSISLIAGPDAHWLVCGFQAGLPKDPSDSKKTLTSYLSATDNGQAGK